MINRRSRLAMVLITLWSLASNRASAADLAQNSPSAKPAPCASAEFHQLDFWAGDWDVFDVENPAAQVARVQVDRILDGCVLREDYQDTEGHKGQSFSIYDAALKTWHQSWVTNRGQLLLLDGNLRGDEVVLNATEHTNDGKNKLIRGTWKPVAGFAKRLSPPSMKARHGSHGSI